MKRHDASVIKKGILLSLVLLSPEILAATENLNFNYTRADASSLDPRLSKLAKACHTLTDPLNINVQFGEMNTQNVRVVMTVYGSNAGKGYAVYTLPGASGKSASGTVNRTALKSGTTDPDLVIPFGLSVQGEASLSVSQTSTTPVYETGYDDPFCFDLNAGSVNPVKYANSNGFAPIYDNPPYSDGFGSRDYQKYCMNFNRVNPDNEEDTYWPDYYGPRPEVISEGMAKPWGEYQGKYIFHRHKYTYDTGLTDSKEELKDIKPTVDAGINALAVEYDFPIYKAGSKYSVLRKGNYQLILNNRDITELVLKISYTVPGQSPGLSVFTWKRDNNYLNNVLAFNGSTQQVPVNSAGNIKDDPYQTFYNDDKKETSTATQDYFRGTLVSGGGLNQKYQDYINNIMPLSLPPTNQGDINLVNTDSLTFSIGQENGISGGAPLLTVYGQPLKFGPLYTGSKLALSAMQVRNACY